MLTSRLVLAAAWVPVWNTDRTSPRLSMMLCLVLRAGSIAVRMLRVWSLLRRLCIRASLQEGVTRMPHSEGGCAVL